MKSYDHALRTGNGLDLRTKDGNKFLQVERVMGGICPAGEGTPFYACLFGSVPGTNTAGKKPLVFIGEAQSELPEPFFEQLAELSRNFLCPHWHHSQENAAAVDSLEQLFSVFAKTRDLAIRFYPAPALNWPVGLTLMQEWAAGGALRIPPEATLAAQLGRMTKEDFQNARRPAFWAVDALRPIMAMAVWSARPQHSYTESARVPFFFG